MPVSTQHYQGREGMDLFRRQVGETVWDVDTTSSDAGSLHLSSNLLSLGTKAIAQRWQNCTGIFQLERGRERVERVHQIAFGLVVVRSGTSELIVSGRSVRVRAGQMYFMNAATQFSKILSPNYCEDFVLARSELLDSERQGYMREPLLVTPMHGTAVLLAEHVQSLLTHGPDIEASAYGSLAAVLLGLVDATFAAKSHPDHVASTREAQRQKIIRFMKARLNDPNLKPARIAAAHRMSLRYLHALFEGCDQSLCATLLEMRLQACKVVLETNRRKWLSVREVAFSHGFVSHAHFCHSFKARFGVSPSDVRNAVQTAPRAAGRRASDRATARPKVAAQASMRSGGQT